jgi:hypothetical protein
MIDEVDAALQSLLTEQIVAGTDIQLAFEAPTKEWSARRNAPTVNLFLYDIQEDLSHRHTGTVYEYDEEGEVVATHDSPRYFALSYLVTAWTTRPQDEHRLLSVLLAGLVRYDDLPRGMLTGTLAGLRLDVPITIAVPPARDRGLADIWTALGGALKPSLDLVVTAPVVTARQAVTDTVTDALVLRTGGPDVSGPELRRLRHSDPGTDDGAGPIGVGRDRELPPGRRRRRGGNPVGQPHR